MAHKNSIRKKLQRYRKKQDLQIGKLGNYQYEVEVPSRPNFVYVRLAGQVVSQVYNDRVNPLLDLEVYVGYDDEEPRLLQVLGVRSDLRRYGTGNDTSAYVPEHHKTHEWMNYPVGGNDVVFSELRQLMPLRPTPMPTGVALVINRGILLSNTKDVLFFTGSIANLGSFIPSTGSRFAYVGIDSFTGLPTVTGGFVRDTLSLTFADIPDFIPGTYPIAIVRLYEGQTKVEEAYSSTDLIDLRFPFIQSFLNLFDVPGSFTGSANKGLFVNSSETKLEFRVLTGTAGTSTFTGTSFLELGDTPDSYAGSAQRVVAVNDAAGGLEFRILTGTAGSSFTGTSFLELGDTPDTYAGSAGKFVKVKGTVDGLEFVTGSSAVAHNILSTEHLDTTGTSPISGDLLVRKSGYWQAEAGINISSDSANISALNLTEQGSNPTAPATGHRIIFAKADGIYEQNSSGTVIGPFITGSSNVGQIVTINFVIDGGGSAINVGIKGDVVIDFNCWINSATLLADQTGSFVVDIWKDVYANFPPTDADSITAAAQPTLSSSVKSQDTTLAGWSTGIASGDILRFNVDSSSIVTRVVLALKATRS